MLGQKENLRNPKFSFVATPNHKYVGPITYNDRDLSKIELGDGSFIPIINQFVYLGSLLTRGCSDTSDVESRIKSASNAFWFTQKVSLCIHEYNLRC